MIDDGSMQKVVESLLAATRPEAAYFLAQDGKRGGIIFFDLKEPAEIPRIAEILFKGSNASVEFTPVMNPDDLKKALSSL